MLSSSSTISLSNPENNIDLLMTRGRLRLLMPVTGKGSSFGICERWNYQLPTEIKIMASGVFVMIW